MTLRRCFYRPSTLWLCLMLSVCPPWTTTTTTTTAPSMFVSAIVVRSEGSGGLATGMAYNVDDNEVIVVGTTFDKADWDRSIPTEQRGECFITVGDVADPTTKTSTSTSSKNNEIPLFGRLSLDMPAVCFGGTSTITHSEEEGLGVASVLGMKLSPDGTTSPSTDGSPQNVGFSHAVVYYLGLVQSSTNDLTELPENLLPVASIQAVESATAANFVGLHVLAESDKPLGASSSSSSSPLQSLLQYWWHSTYPPDEGLITGQDTVDPSTLTQQAPHVRKQDLFSGDLAYDVQLDPTDGSTALIAGLVLPSSSEKGKHVPLIVVGSTNGADTSDSLFGQTSSPKTTDQTDWDGYILFLDPNTGAVFDHTGRSTGTDVTTSKPRPSIRINSVGDADDFIRGLCLSPNQRYLYVVGTTQGIIEGIHNGGAFMIKYDLEDSSSGNGVSMQWQYQINGLNVQGLACTADADAVYLGGLTESNLWDDAVQGGNNVQATLSPDAFITKLSALEGRAEWTKPLDTTKQGDSRREVIVDMEITSRGYVLVLFNSMNLQTGKNDIFLVDLDPTTGQHDLLRNGGTTWGMTIPNTDSTTAEDKDTRRKTVIIAAITVPVLLALAVFGGMAWRYRTDVERFPKSLQLAHKKQEELQEAKTAPSTPSAHDDAGRDTGVV